MVKLKLISVSKTYAAEKAKFARLQLTELQKQLNDILDLQTTSLVSLHDQEHSLRTQIEEIMEERTMGTMFRSKARWIEEGERSSKYFFRLEKQRFNYKTMNCVVNQDGTISHNQRVILGRQAEYYKKLYQADSDIHFTLSMKISHALQKRIRLC